MRQRVETGHWQEGDKIWTIELSEFGVARSRSGRRSRCCAVKVSSTPAGQDLRRQAQNRHWLNLANDFESMVDSVKSNVLKRVHIEENVAAPQLAAHEGKPAEATPSCEASVMTTNRSPSSISTWHAISL